MANEKSNSILESIRIKVDSWESDTIKIGELVDSLEGKSFDLAILVIALPMIIPMPPGIPMFAGMLMAVLSFQALKESSRAWTPNFIARKTIGKTGALVAIDKADKWLNWVLRLLKNRYPSFLDAPFKQLTYVMVLVLGFIMILPIPFIGNPVPALACVLLMLGRLNHDGLVILVALIFSILALTLSVLVGVESWKLLELLFNQ